MRPTISVLVWFAAAEVGGVFVTMLPAEPVRPLRDWLNPPMSKIPATVSPKITVFPVRITLPLPAPEGSTFAAPRRSTPETMEVSPEYVFVAPEKICVPGPAFVTASLLLPLSVMLPLKKFRPVAATPAAAAFGVFAPLTVCPAAMVASPSVRVMGTPFAPVFVTVPVPASASNVSLWPLKSNMPPPFTTTLLGLKI